MIARWQQISSSALVVLLAVSSANGQANAPSDQQIAEAIAPGSISSKTPNRTRGTGTTRRNVQHRLGMTALAGLRPGKRRRRDAPAIGKAREVVAELARRIGSNLRPRAGDPVSGSMSARAAGRVRRLDPDLGAGWPAAITAESGTTLFLAASMSREGARPDRARRSAQGGAECRVLRRARATIPIPSSRSWACGRPAGTASTRISHWNRSTAIPLVAAPDGRWGYGRDAGLRGDVVRGIDGAGDRGGAAEPGRTADGPSAGRALAADRRFKRHSVRSARMLARGDSVRHLLPLVARTGLRRAGLALARRI